MVQAYDDAGLATAAVPPNQPITGLNRPRPPVQTAVEADQAAWFATDASATESFVGRFRATPSEYAAAWPVHLTHAAYVTKIHAPTHIVLRQAPAPLGAKVASEIARRVVGFANSQKHLLGVETAGRQRLAQTGSVDTPLAWPVGDGDGAAAKPPTTPTIAPST